MPDRTGTGTVGRMRWLPALSLVVTLLIVAAFTGGLVVMFM